MASGSSSQGSSRAPARAPPLDDAHHAPQPSLNPDFVDMTATELIAHLNRHRRTADFADAALVFAARERRLTEAEQLVRVGDKRVDRLLEGNRARDAQIRQATETEERLRAQIRALQQARAAEAKARPLQQPRATNAKARTRHGSGPSGHGLTQLRMNASSSAFPSSGDENVGFDTSVDAKSDEGEVGDHQPRYKSLRMNASPGSPRRSARQAKQPRRRS